MGSGTHSKSSMGSAFGWAIAATASEALPKGLESRLASVKAARCRRAARWGTVTCPSSGAAAKE